MIEYLDVLDELVDPPDPADAFHVVLPSLPGYGFSGKPKVAGWGVERIAVAWAQLMDRLGYERYGAQGGDWGSVITSALGTAAPENVVGIHLTMPLALRPEEEGPLTKAEKKNLAARKFFERVGTGYSAQQATRPQTLGYGLADSPMGQCCWIVEKFWDWTDSAGPPENVISRNRLLDNVMLYWLNNTGASSARLYWESFAQAPDGPGGGADRGDAVPAGAVAAAPGLDRAALHRPAALERAGDRRALRQPGAARGVPGRAPRLLPPATPS